MLRVRAVLGHPGAARAAPVLRFGRRCIFGLAGGAPGSQKVPARRKKSVRAVTDERKLSPGERGNDMKKSRYSRARRALIFWTLFIGIGAVFGALCMLIDPSGKKFYMDAMLPYFQVLPFADVLFTDLTFSGIALLVVNGLTNLTAAALIFAKKKSGVILGGVFGITLMLLICIQFYIFPPNFMSSIYFVFGAAQAATGYAAWVFCCQEHFCVSEKEYPNIGKAPDRLVVYFSRMGYTKKAALEEAERTGACVFEVRSTERTEGTLGF